MLRLRAPHRPLRERSVFETRVRTANAAGSSLHSRIVDACQRCAYLVRVVGTHDARDFPAFAQEHERRPELHAKRAAEAPARTVRYLDMAHSRMIRERRGKQRLRCAAVATPRVAEF